MKIFGYQVSDENGQRITHATNIVCGALAGRFVVYPVVTYASETIKENLPGLTKGLINNVISPVLTRVAACVAPLVPDVAKVGLLIFAAFAAKEYYDFPKAYERPEIHENLYKLGRTTLFNMSQKTQNLLGSGRNTNLFRDLSARFNQSTPALPAAGAAQETREHSDT